MNIEVMKRASEIFPQLKPMINRVELGGCPLCGEIITTEDVDKMDGLSKREYNISGMCQKCQDDFFGGEEE